MSSLVVNNLPYIEMMGQKVVLDRPFAPPRAEAEYLQPFFYNVFSNLGLDCETYSINLNLPSDSEHLTKLINTASMVNGKIEVKTERKLKSVKKQRIILDKIIGNFISYFQATMRRVAPKNSIINSYAIAYELTQKGVIHAHGILQMNNMYYTAVSQHMAMAWVRASGSKACAQRKLNNKGLYDNAFDKCANFDSWTRYMFKECNNEVLDSYYNYHIEQWLIKDKYLDPYRSNEPIIDSELMEYSSKKNYILPEKKTYRNAFF